MSMTADGRAIRCDGPGCQAEAKAPAGLRKTLAEGAAHGWLFLFNRGDWAHLCPDCIHKYADNDPQAPLESACVIG